MDYILGAWKAINTHSDWALSQIVSHDNIDHEMTEIADLAAG